MNIRCVGGLLSAYTLTKDTFLLDQVTDLARRLLPAFNTPTGIPRTSVHLRTYGSRHVSASLSTGELVQLLRGPGIMPFWPMLPPSSSSFPIFLQSPITLSLPKRFKSQPVFFSTPQAMKVYEVLRSHQPAGKLYPVFVNVDNAGLSGPSCSSPLFLISKVPRILVRLVIVFTSTC